MEIRDVMEIPFLKRLTAFRLERVVEVLNWRYLLNVLRELPVSE